MATPIAIVRRTAVVTPLAGRRILITRARDDMASWAHGLQQHGAVPVLLPCVSSERIAGECSATALREALIDAAWVVFTSRRGVAAAAALLDGNWPRSLRVAAVGLSTAGAVTDAFSQSALVPEQQTGAGLGAALAERIRADTPRGRPRVVIVGAAGGRRDVARALTGHGIPVVRRSVYRTIPAAEREPRLDLASLNVEQVWLASPSAVRGLRNQAGCSPDIRIISIGPTTSAAVHAAGLTVSAQALAPNFSGMLRASE